MKDPLQTIVENTIVYACNLYNITPEDLPDVRRAIIYVHPKHCIVYALKNNFPKLTWRQIGEYLQRHHSTIINSWKIAIEIAETNPVLVFSPAKKNLRENLHATDEFVKREIIALTGVERSVNNHGE